MSDTKKSGVRIEKLCGDTLLIRVNDLAHMELYVSTDEARDILAQLQEVLDEHCTCIAIIKDLRAALKEKP